MLRGTRERCGPASATVVVMKKMLIVDSDETVSREGRMLRGRRARCDPVIAAVVVM